MIKPLSLQSRRRFLAQGAAALGSGMLSACGGDSIDSGTWQLDHIIAQTFRWWDLVLTGRTPLVL